MIHAPHIQIQKQPSLSHIISGIYCTLCLITGIMYAFTLQWEILCTCICSILLAYFFDINKSTILCGILLFATGYARLHFITQQHATILNRIAHHTTIQGTITAVEKASHKQYHSAIFVTINYYCEQGVWKSYDQPWQLQCYTKQQFNGSIDDTIIIQNFHYKTPANKSSFFYFLMKEGIHATLFLNQSDYKIIGSRPNSLQQAIYKTKYRVLEGISGKCSSLATTLISSIFLGNRLYVKEQYQQIKQLFSNWGILHFLARSGAHMIMFIFFLQYFLQLLPAPFATKQLLLLVLSLVYAIFSWQSVSFSRALATFICYKLCHLSAIQISSVQLIVLLSCSFLLYNPLHLFFLDFQLSFGITLVLAIINHYLFT